MLGCLSSQTSEPSPVARSVENERVPVVFVPGVTGVVLVEADTRKPVWGTGRTLLRPHDRGYGASRGLSREHLAPRIVPDRVIAEMRLFGVFRVEVYQSIVDLFLANGFRQGDLGDPAAEEDFFLFAYDWRDDNVESAALLARQLENLRRRTGRDRLRVDLVCQSNGAHVCRYFAKYGGTGLEAAESGSGAEAGGVTVRRLVLIGSSNGGSIRILRELNRGRRYIQAIGRLFSPETLFTFVSLFQDLPVYTGDLFVDASGEPLSVDLFDAATWEQYGWSIFADEVRSRLTDDTAPLWLGTDRERRAYLVRSLGRARRFHALLRRDVGHFESTRVYLIENDHNDTASKAVLRQREGRWQTLFADDKAVRRQPQLYRAVVERGDGHATVASQEWLSAQERRGLERRVIGVDVSHRKIVLRPEVQRVLIEVLTERPESER